MLLLVWNFFFDVKQAKGNKVRVILAGLVNLTFLNKTGVPGPQPCSGAGGRLSTSKASPVKSEWHTTEPHQKNSHPL